MPSLYDGTVYKTVRCSFCGADITGVADEPTICEACRAECSEEIISQLSKQRSPHAYPNPDDSSQRAKDGPPKEYFERAR